MIKQKAIEFQRLHRAGNCFIMANAWNAGSAILLEQAGFNAIGTTCLYVPGIRDIDTIRELVAAVDAPVNVVMGLSGTPISLVQLRQAGVTRISIGGSLARATLGLVRRAAQEMLEEGSFNFASDQIPDAELSKLFSGRTDS